MVDVDKAAQDREFIEEHAAFVHGIVKKTRAQLGIDRDVEDLVGFAYQGLLEARLRYDPSRSIQFTSFAYYRVRGAIIDGVRSMAYLPRRAYARLLASEAADLEAESAAQALALPGATRSAEGSLRAVDGILGRIAAAYTVASGTESDEEQTGIDPEQQMLKAEHAKRITRALSRLAEDDRTLLRGYYIDGHSFNDIAVKMGVSKSWISRMHTRALNNMRVLLSAD